MATKVFILLSSGGKELALDVGLLYPLNAAKNRWMDEVKVIIFGPAEKLVVSSPEVREKIKELQETGVEIMACKWLADEWNITGKLEDLGIKLVYVGPIISQLLKDGWASLTF